LGLGAGVRAVYEAGPTGFGLARASRERGIDVRLAAPDSIPKGAGDRVKTDRRAPSASPASWRRASCPSRSCHLHHERRKPAGVVALACARELATFLWEAATLD